MFGFRFCDSTADNVPAVPWVPRPISSRFGMPSWLAKRAAAEPPAAVGPLPELLDELLDELLEELREPLPDDAVVREELAGLPDELLLVLLPVPDGATLRDDATEAPVALSAGTPPQATKLIQTAAAAAMSSGEDQGFRIRAGPTSLDY